MSDAHLIVFGNEKGGTGKSTMAMHVAVHIASQGKRVHLIDLDVRQRTTSRFLENRRDTIGEGGLDLPLPGFIALEPTTDKTRDQQQLQTALDRARVDADFIVIDCPGSFSYLSQLAHALADTLVTPLNDSFIDLDVLGQVDGKSFQVKRLSHYAEMVFDSRKFRAAAGHKPTDWVVARNRLSTLNSINNRRVQSALESLQKKIMFRHVPGLNERVIYRELFPRGLTMMDLDRVPEYGRLNVSQVTARNEVRQLVRALNLNL